jgi:hypothetical protein
MNVLMAVAMAWAGAGAGETGEKVAIRTADGRFLRAAVDGTVRPDRLLPGDEEQFELRPGAAGHVSLKAANGRFLTAVDYDARRLRADSPRSAPADRETFQVVPVDGNRVALKARGYRDFLVFSAARGTLQPSADKPRPEEIVEIFRTGEIPEAMCTALAGLVRGIVAEELNGKPYDKVRSRKVERFVELPAPSLHDLRRTRSHRVLSMIEEYHVKAELDGQPEIQIARMPTLKGYRDSAVSLLMFSVKASVPAKGHVSYKIPGAVSVSTGFRATARLSLVGEVRTVKSGDRLSFSSPELRDARVELQGLHLSNDLLNAAREPIEDIVNHELRHNQERIRQQANKSLAKAMKSREFHNPLLRLL